MKYKCFRNFDLMHTPMSLSYKNEYFYTTNIGAILTILCFIIIIGIGAFEIKSLYDKSSFTIISNQYIDLNEKIDFSETPLLFQLIDNKGEILKIDEKLFEFIAYDMEWYVGIDENGKKDYKVINTKLEIDQCSKVLLNNTDYLASLDLSTYICIKSGQNITSYGYLGDMNNGYKGFRIYLNKCNGKVNCYNDSYIIKTLQNIKFRVSYLGLNTNIFDFGNQKLNYQMFSKSCSVSTNILKKFYFTFSIGRLYLYNNIFFKKRKKFDYIIGNDAIMDFDLDPSSTINKNSNTLAYFSFNFNGDVVEVSKEVKRFFDTFSVIGNAFNIALTIFKIINNYYSNKILFADIFKSLFFIKENTNINQNKFKLFNNFNDNNKNHKKDNLDISDSIGINNSNFFKFSSNKKVLTADKNKNKKKLSQRLSLKGNIINKQNLFYFYIFPICLLKKTRNIKYLCIIKDKICRYFSIEKVNELIKFKDAIDNKMKKSRIYNTELIKVNKKFDESNDSILKN